MLEYKPTQFVWLKLIIFGAALCVFGVHVLCIDNFSANVPYWDQWDSEAYLLYAPYLEGRYHFLDLFELHNEHRIFFTKVLGLFTLELFDGWYPRYEMILNSILLSGFIVVFLDLLSRVLGRGAFILVAIVATFLLGFPFAWENVLGAFQSQFYFLLLFSMICFRTLPMVPCWSPLWLVGVLSAACAFFSMAGGLFVAAASGLCLVLQLVRRARSRTLREVTGALALFVLAYAFYAWIPHVAHHEGLKAQGVRHFFSALGQMAGWPQLGELSFFLNLPIATFVLFVVLRRPPIKRHEWAIVGMSFFVFGLIVATAYGRAIQPLAPRYLEITAINALLNLTALCYLAARVRFVMIRPVRVAPSRQIWSRWVPGAWAAVMVCTALIYALFHTYPEIQIKAHRFRMQEENVKRFVTTGDVSHLQNKGYLEIPYPNPDRLAMIAAMPSIEGILAPELGGERGAYGPSLLPEWVSSLARWILGLVISSGSIIALAGAGMLGVGIYRLRSATEPSEGPRHHGATR